MFTIITIKEAFILLIQKLKTIWYAVLELGYDQMSKPRIYVRKNTKATDSPSTKQFINLLFDSQGSSFPFNQNLLELKLGLTAIVVFTNIWKHIRTETKIRVYKNY